MWMQLDKNQMDENAEWMQLDVNQMDANAEWMLLWFYGSMVKDVDLNVV